VSPATLGRMIRRGRPARIGALALTVMVGLAGASSAAAGARTGPGAGGVVATNLVLVAGVDVDFPPGRGARALSSSPVFEVTGASLDLDVSRSGGTVEVRQGGVRLAVRPRSVLQGLPGFLSWTLRRPDGTVQASGQVDVCPMPGTVFAAHAWSFHSSFIVDPANVDTPARSPFPQECGDPLTTRARWGFPTGWAAQTHIAVPDDTPPGPYTLDASVNPDGSIREADRSDDHVRMPVEVLDITGGAPGATADPSVRSGRPHVTTPGATPTRAAGPALSRDYTGPVELPDLVPLPSENVAVRHQGGGDLLRFNSTMANLGHGPLQVDGFRSGAPAGQMLAFQNLFHNGVAVASRPAGTLIYEADEDEWHFDFLARYQLVDQDGTVVANSGKIGFCLADVHQLDAQPGLVIPDVTGFVGCFGALARSVRETIDAGWGDEYDQVTADQELDITSVRNGTYRIQILADPDHKLQEATRGNNTSQRTIMLGGVPGSRTVTVPPIDGVDTETAWAAEDLPF